jgi:hypothetical protein
MLTVTRIIINVIFVNNNNLKTFRLSRTHTTTLKGSFSWWLYKCGSLGLEAARPMGAQFLKNAAAWLGLC